MDCQDSILKDEGAVAKIREKSEQNFIGAKIKSPREEVLLGHHDVDKEIYH